MKTRRSETSGQPHSEATSAETIPRALTNNNQRTTLREKRTTGPQLYLSGFWEALDDAQESSLLKIVPRTDKRSGRQTDYDFPELICEICSTRSKNTTELETHILKSHCTVAEQEFCRDVQCVPNRVHDMVRKALEQQEAQGIFKIQFLDSNNYYLTMPFNHPITKYLRLFNIQISFNPNRIRKSKQWRIFEMKNHKDEILSVHVNFEPHIADEANKRWKRIFKTLMHWQDQSEEFVRDHYNALPPNGKRWIAECLKQQESVEPLLTLFTSYEIYEKKKSRGYFIQLRDTPLERDGNLKTENHQKSTTKRPVEVNTVVTTVQEQATVVKKTEKKNVNQVTKINRIAGLKKDVNGVGRK